jgi:hypothetical protein
MRQATNIMEAVSFAKCIGAPSLTLRPNQAGLNGF